MRGYVGNKRRREGQVFEIEESAFSKSWMVRVEVPKKDIKSKK